MTDALRRSQNASPPTNPYAPADSLEHALLMHCVDLLQLTARQQELLRAALTYPGANFNASTTPPLSKWRCRLDTLGLKQEDYVSKVAHFDEQPAVVMNMEKVIVRQLSQPGVLESLIPRHVMRVGKVCLLARPSRGRLCSVSAVVRRFPVSLGTNLRQSDTSIIRDGPMTGSRVREKHSHAIVTCVQDCHDQWHTLWKGSFWCMSVQGQDRIVKLLNVSDKVRSSRDLTSRSWRSCSLSAI